MKPQLSATSEDKWMYEPHIPYEITIRPYKQLDEDDLRFVKAHKELKDLLTNMSFNYFLIPELSMPKYSNIGKQQITYIHWHGLIKFTDSKSIYNFLLTEWNKLTHRYHIQINQYRPDYWNKYITKQINIIPKEFSLKNDKLKYVMAKGPPLEN